MGVKSLHKFLKQKTINLFKEVSFSDYSGKCIAIDTNLYLYRFKKQHGSNWIKLFYRMMSEFIHYKIRCVCIYDSKAPEEKYTIQRERDNKRRMAKHKAERLNDKLNNYQNNSIVDDELIAIMKKHINKSFLLNQEEMDTFIDTRIIQDEIRRCEMESLNVHRWEIDLSKELLSALSITYFDSPSEAETLCAHLCVDGQVDAVLSNDSDVLVYGTPFFLTDMNMTRKTFKQVNYEELLEQLSLSSSQFLDFCIMCGTDYNNNIPKIGPKKSFKYISEYQSIDAFQEAYPNIDTSILNHHRIREIFTVPREIARHVIHKHPHISKERLDHFAQSHNLFVSPDYKSISYNSYNQQDKVHEHKRML